MMTRMRRLPSVHFWASTKPASMVLPRPTSSARIAPFDSGRLKRKKSSLDLMGVEVYLRVHQGTSELLGVSDGSPPGKLVREQLRVVLRGQFRPLGFT